MKKIKLSKKITTVISALLISAVVTTSVSAATWDVNVRGALSNSQGTAKLMDYGDEAIGATINVVNSNNYKTSAGETKYIRAYITYNYSSMIHDDTVGTVSTGRLEAKKYDNRLIKSFWLPTAVVANNGRFWDPTYTVNDVLTVKGSIEKIIGNKVLHYDY